MRRRLPMFDALIAVLAVLVTVGAIPSELIAQETAAATLVPGRRSITFGVFSGGSGSFGVWKMRDERTNLGLLADLRFSTFHLNVEGDDNDRSSSEVSAAVGPEVHRYADFTGRVAPYGFLGARLGATYRKAVSEPDLEDESWSADLSGLIGLGVEFFLVPNLSIAAQTGLGASLAYDPRDTAAGDATQVSFHIGTFTMSLGGAIYF